MKTFPRLEAISSEDTRTTQDDRLNFDLTRPDFRPAQPRVTNTSTI